MAWKGTELVIRIAADLKKYRDDLRAAGRDTRAEMERAARSTDGMTSATKRLEGQAARTAEQVVAIGRAASSGDFARAGQEMAGMATGASRAGVAVGGLSGVFGLAAAAVGAYLLVSYKASQEHERQANLLRLTGNAAGLLAGDINAMARRVARDADSTVASAREITEALVATGKFGRTATESVAGAIELMSQASGRSRESVTGDFAKMSDGVAKWAATHNEKYHFLTLAQYQHIKALEDAGRAQEAMIVVGEAFKTHLAGVGENLGWAERAWRSMGQAASWAWDKAMDVGRADTTSDRLQSVTDNVNEMRRVLELRQASGQAGPIAVAQRNLDLALQQQALMQETMRMEQRSANARADNAAAEARGIEALKTAEKERAEQRQRDLEAGELRNRLAGEEAKEQERQRAAASKAAAADAKDQRQRDLQAGELRNKLAGDMYKEQERLSEAARKADAAMTKVYTDSAANAQERLETMRIEADAAALAESQQISMARAIELTTVARLKEQQVAAMGNEAMVLALQAEIDAREEIVRALAGREVREAGERLRKDEADAWKRTWDQIGQSFTDALMQGGKSVKEYLIGLFRTIVLRPILAPVGGAITSLFSGSAAAGQAGGGGGMGIISGVKSVYDAVMGGFTAIGDGVAFAADQVGAWLMNNTTGVLNQMGGQIMANAGAIGTVASYAGGVAAGVTIGRAISGGYSAVGKSGNTAVNVGTAIGAIFGPLGAALGGAIGGLVNRAFGRKAPVSTGSGITGTFSTTGASVQAYENWFAKGGWFRSNKSGTNYSAVSKGLDDFLDESLVQLTGATKAFATILGLNADSIDGITQSINVSLAGLNAEQQQAAIIGAVNGFGDTLAQQLLGTFVEVTSTTTKSLGAFATMASKKTGDTLAASMASLLERTITTVTRTWVAGQFVREGETAGEALYRLGSSLAAVNSIFDTLNVTLLESTLVGGDAASKLIDGFGGLESYTSAMSSYNQAYYSEAERSATTTRQLTKAMADIGVTMPTSMAAFRALVEQQDLYTESGRATYTALIGMSGVFASLTESIARLGSAVQDEVQRLRGLLTTESSNSLGALQAQFATGTAAARAGDRAALERLPSISQAIEEAARLQAVTAADVALVRGQLAASLSATLAALGLDVPQFAAGGMHRGGFRMVGERGPEIEATGPARYFSARQTAAMLGGGNDPALIAELQALRSEVVALRAEVRAGVGHGAQAARILTRVSRNGEAFQTEAVT